MKKLLSSCLLVLFILGVSSCKKDYPRDIPKWLKNKIKELKKETRRKNGCGLGLCASIEEFSDGSNIFYLWITGTAEPAGIIIFDYDGNFQCQQSNYDSGSCGEITELETYYFTRHIWEETNY
jgi:hypothetical protein